MAALEDFAPVVASLVAAGVAPAVAFLVRLLEAVVFFLVAGIVAGLPFAFPLTFAVCADAGLDFAFVLLPLGASGGFEGAGVAGVVDAVDAVDAVGFFRLRFREGLLEDLDLLTDTVCLDSKAFRVASDILIFLVGGSSASTSLLKQQTIHSRVIVCVI